MPQNNTNDIRSLIDTIRQLRPDSPRQDFKAAMGQLRKIIPGKGRFAERQPFGKAILKISQGLHPDAALVKEGKLEPKEASPEGLSSLFDFLKDENKKNAPLADLQPEDSKASATEIAKNVGKDVGQGISDRLGKLPGKAARLAGKLGKGALKIADVGEFINAGKIVRNTLLAAQVKDELDRRKRQKDPESDNPSGPSDGHGFGNNGPLDDILAKDPRDLTEAEFLELKKEVIKLPAGPEQDRLDSMATAFLEDKFGTGPAKIDAVGRMIEPEPIRPINKSPVPAKTPDGEPLQGALKRIGKAVAGNMENDGRAPAVQALQTGLNLLKQVMLKESGKHPALGSVLASDLKTDGVVGPKTRRALKLATSRLGRAKVEEGLALGRFGRFAQNVQSGRDDTRSLGRLIGMSFGPLFRNPKNPQPRSNRAPEENFSLQATVNDLGFKAFGRDTFKPIKEDGFIGPKTESAFNTVLPAIGPDRFTSHLGHNLGFFDFSEIA